MPSLSRFQHYGTSSHSWSSPTAWSTMATVSPSSPLSPSSNASSPEWIGEMDRIRLVPVPDGLGPDEDRAGDFVRMMSSIVRTMPESLEKLIMESKDVKNSDRGGDDDDEEEEITCMIVDGAMQFTLEVARKMRLRSAVFWPAAAALDVPRLIADGVIDADG